MEREMDRFTTTAGYEWMLEVAVGMTYPVNPERDGDAETLDLLVTEKHPNPFRPGRRPNDGLTVRKFVRQKPFDGYEVWKRIS